MKKKSNSDFRNKMFKYHLNGPGTKPLTFKYVNPILEAYAKAYRNNDKQIAKLTKKLKALRKLLGMK